MVPIRPGVSIIIPCRNEVQYIESCVRSILVQEAPGVNFEVLVADGMSDDGTREILARLADTDPRLRIVDNPQQIVSTGLNVAIRAARGSVIVRIDVHTEYAPDYLRQCLSVLEETGADNVGGRLGRVRARVHRPSNRSNISVTVCGWGFPRPCPRIRRASGYRLSWMLAAGRFQQNRIVRRRVGSQSGRRIQSAAGPSGRQNLAVSAHQESLRNERFTASLVSPIPAIWVLESPGYTKAQNAGVCHVLGSWCVRPDAFDPCLRFNHRTDRALRVGVYTRFLPVCGLSSIRSDGPPAWLEFSSSVSGNFCLLPL